MNIDDDDTLPDPVVDVPEPLDVLASVLVAAALRDLGIVPDPDPDESNRCQPRLYGCDTVEPCLPGARP